MIDLTERFNESQPSKQNGKPADATEHTLGGKLIGGLRDLVEGSAESPAQAAKRAQTDDSIANIAADTAAMIPGVKWFAAGAIRATLLSDPTVNLLNERESIVKNFAEGAALSGVTKLSGRILETNVFGNETFARSMLSKSVGLFSFGFGASAVQSGFASDTWKNGTGQVSLVSGAERVLEAGTIGGVIGIPAGAVGSGIGALGFSAAARVGLSEGLTKIATAAGSGYAAGAVFGGSDAAMHGQSLSNVLSSANESGLIGLLAGGVTGATMRSPFSAGQPEAHQNIVFESGSQLNLVAGDAARHPADSSTARYHPADNLFDRVNVERPRVSLRAAERKLGPYKIYSADFEVPKAKAGEVPAIGKTQLEFRRASSDVVNKDVRVYSVHGSQIIVPDDYAQQLDHVLSLRKAAEDASAQHDGTPESEQRLLNAQVALANHPLANRAHPIDFLRSLAELPDRSIAKRILLVDWKNPDDGWHSATYKDGFVSAATASPNGDITFYQPKVDAFLQGTHHHEWAHVLKFTSTRESATYDNAFIVERNGPHVSDYAERNSDENWAEHTAAFIKPDPTEFFDMAAGAPVRTTVLAQALVKALAFAPPGSGSVMAHALAGRIEYVQQSVYPNAIESLSSTLAANDVPIGQRVAAAKVLGEIGSSKDMELLAKVARNSKNPTLAKVAFDAGFAGVFRQGESWKGYTTRTGPSNIDAQIDYLVSVAQKGSFMRSTALDYLYSLPNERATGYYELLTLDQFQGSKLAQAFKLMRSIPDLSGKQQAWHEALKQLGSDADGRVNLALATLEHVPALRSTALDMLMAQAQPRTLPALEAVAKSSNPEWSNKAREAIDYIQAKQHIAELETQLRARDPAQRAEAIRSLGETKSQQAIMPLLMQVAGGEATESTLAAYELRSNFQDSVVKHYARRLVMQQPKMRAHLRLILDNAPLNLSAAAAPERASQ